MTIKYFECFTPLSTIYQSKHGDQFYCWEKIEVLVGKTTDLSGKTE